MEAPTGWVTATLHALSSGSVNVLQGVPGQHHGNQSFADTLTLSPDNTTSVLSSLLIPAFGAPPLNQASKRLARIANTLTIELLASNSVDLTTSDPIASVIS